MKARSARPINPMQKLALMGMLSVKPLDLQQKEALLAKLNDMIPAFDLAANPWKKNAEHCVAWLTLGEGVVFEKEVLRFNSFLKKLLVLLSAEQSFAAAISEQCEPDSVVDESLGNKKLLSLFLDNYPIIAYFMHAELLHNPIIDQANTALKDFIAQLNTLHTAFVKGQEDDLIDSTSRPKILLSQINSELKNNIDKQKDFFVPLNSTAVTTLMLRDGTSVKTSFEDYNQALQYVKKNEIVPRKAKTYTPIKLIVKALHTLGLSCVITSPVRASKLEAVEVQLRPGL